MTLGSTCLREEIPLLQTQAATMAVMDHGTMCPAKALSRGEDLLFPITICPQNSVLLIALKVKKNLSQEGIRSH